MSARPYPVPSLDENKSRVDECRGGGASLHDLALRSKWPELLQRLQSHPHEALHVVDGFTPLHAMLGGQSPPPPLDAIRAYLEVKPEVVHILTNKRRSALLLSLSASHPVEIIAALASADPSTVLIQDYRGRNVFHICSLRPTEEGTLSTLLTIAGPETARQALLMLDAKRQAPIHYACYAESPISNQDFAAMARATLEQELSVSPLRVLTSKHSSQLLAASQRRRNNPTREISTDDPSPFCNPERSISIERMWMWRPSDSLNLWRCLRKAFVLLGTDESDLASYPLLHSCLENDDKCRPLLTCLLTLNPHYACQRRESDGALPIHLVAQMNTEAEPELWLGRLNKLLELYPKGAAVVDGQGKLPLEILVRPKGPATWKQVYVLLEANPWALASLDLSESFYPRILSRLLASRRTMDMAYRILLQTPTLFQR